MLRHNDFENRLTIVKVVGHISLNWLRIVKAGLFLNGLKVVKVGN